MGEAFGAVGTEWKRGCVLGCVLVFGVYTTEGVCGAAENMLADGPGTCCLKIGGAAMQLATGKFIDRPPQLRACKEPPLAKIGRSCSTGDIAPVALGT